MLSPGTVYLLGWYTLAGSSEGPHSTLSVL